MKDQKCEPFHRFHFLIPYEYAIRSEVFHFSTVSSSNFKLSGNFWVPWILSTAWCWDIFLSSLSIVTTFASSSWLRLRNNLSHWQVDCSVDFRYVYQAFYTGMIFRNAPIIFYVDDFSWYYCAFHQYFGLILPKDVESIVSNQEKFSLSSSNSSTTLIFWLMLRDFIWMVDSSPWDVSDV